MLSFLAIFNLSQYYKIKNGVPSRKALSEKEFETFRECQLKEGTSVCEARKIIYGIFGHRTEEMTQTYLDSFENKVVDEYDELLFG